MTTIQLFSRTDQAVEAAQGRLRRLTADEVPGALRAGAYLVDIRPAAQRAQEGQVPGALVIERNVLEWRCDPTNDARLPQAVDDDVQWIIVSSLGHTSSLAAAALADLGLYRATDVIGGYHALAAAGHLVEPIRTPALYVGVQQRTEAFSLVGGPRRWM